MGKTVIPITITRIESQDTLTVKGICWSLPVVNEQFVMLDDKGRQFQTTNVLTILNHIFTTHKHMYGFTIEHMKDSEELCGITKAEAKLTKSKRRRKKSFAKTRK